ncbi:PA2779 family protein [Limnobacter humi]|uniref:PA2779 family protein n=1 Tax=Limnobacter humi TaxID=1778671 RepID=A0ABT1WJ62_9BURK|nr:PA2779 family protein [Limnobacter humi]MCQ8896454.1 PA2779 family protein [Limnobacter humi]
MKKAIRATSLAVLLSFGTTFIAGPAMAAMVGTEEAVVAHQNRDELKKFFDREDIAKALQAHGVTADMAKARVDAMTDEEAQKLAAHIDNAPAGAGIVGTLFAVFIILLVTDILGLTKVFPFTRSVR